MFGPLVEGVRVARSQRTVSILVALISATTVVAALQVASSSIAAHDAVRKDLERSGARTLTVYDDSGKAEISAASVARIDALSSVAWAVGFGPVSDVSAFDGGVQIGISNVVGSSPDLVLRAGVDHRQGVLASREALSRAGLTASVGQVNRADRTPLPVVGTFTATGALSGLSSRFLAVEDSWRGPLRTIIIEAKSARDVVEVAASVRAVLGSSGAESIRVEVPQALAEARARIDTTLAGSGRLSVIVALVVGLLFTSSTILAGVLGRRRDFGRRRALGASRSQLLVVIMSETLTPAIPAVIVAAVCASLVMGSQRTELSFSIAVAVLTVLVDALAALIPGVFVALLDPLRVLRVP